MPGRAASGRNDGWAHLERRATAQPWGGGAVHTRRHRQSPQPCLACRPHGRSDISGLLGTVVAFRITPVLAVLLVGVGGHRPQLPTRDGH